MGGGVRLCVGASRVIWKPVGTSREPIGTGRDMNLVAVTDHYVAHTVQSPKSPPHTVATF